MKLRATGLQMEQEVEHTNSCLKRHFSTKAYLQAATWVFPFFE